nr:hypothetical protein [uncultured bacterium]
MKGFLAFLVILFSSGAFSSVANQARWEFKVFLDNREIGSHQFTVSEKSGRQLIETKANFDVKVLFVNLYSYRHQNREVWQGDCLASIDSVTDDNGKRFLVEGSVNGDRFEVNTADAQKQLPGCIKTFAYWNPAFLSAKKLLNVQTGKYEDVSIEKVGEETLTIQGRAIDALKYVVNLDAGPITLWYSAGDYLWLALESAAKGGRTLRYAPIALPADAAYASLAAI